MQPERLEVFQCRACKSARVIDLGVARNYYLANLDQTVSISYRICRDCQFIFQGQYVGDEYLNAYYRISPMLRRKEPTPYEISQSERQGDFLRRHIDLQDRQVLEIGAHTGAFLMHLNRQYKCKTFFEELSEEAKALLSAQPGLADFQTIPDRTNSMDLVVLRHVLEHIFDLESFLAYVKSILKNDGVLFIEVPDWSFLDSHTDPLIFEHLNQFNTYSLVALLRRLGWQVEVVEKSIHPDDPATPNRVQRIVARPSLLPDLGNLGVVDAFSAFAAINYDAWKNALNRLLHFLGHNKTVALYPASHLTFEALTESRLQDANVVGMFDIDQKKQGREILGIMVYPPEELKKLSPDLVLIFTMGYEREIRESFASMGLTSEVVSLSELVQDGWNRS